ncbi:EamA family transporter [Streptomyces sp. NPDC051940]|uniref:DMT family transporter n=1 Tax=Streptomyces sp. NPDC051940 TaxID=3155675 RepID=UPI00343A8F70
MEGIRPRRCGTAGVWVAITAVAPVAWGTNYYVTRAFLPDGQPLYGAAIRALPAGLLLLALVRRLPRGAWWWRSAVLGLLNMGGFFALVYVAAQRLPTSVASTVMATSPLVMMLFAWPVIAERPRAAHLAGAAAGLGGVALMLGGGSPDTVGLLASAGAMAMSSLGYVLAKRWTGEGDVLATTSWQLVAGGLLLLPAAAVAEGAPPALSGASVAGFAYVSLVATALAFAAWFAGLRRLPAATVGLVGLLNPVTGVLLGTLVASETLSAVQLCGLALALGAVALGRPGGPGRRGGGVALGRPNGRARRRGARAEAVRDRVPPAGPGRPTQTTVTGCRTTASKR